LVEQNVLGGFQNPVPDLLRRLDAGVDSRNDADENPLMR
jgi:hypothetical protein